MPTIQSRTRVSLLEGTKQIMAGDELQHTRVIRELGYWAQHGRGRVRSMATKACVRVVVYHVFWKINSALYMIKAPGKMAATIVRLCVITKTREQRVSDHGESRVMMARGLGGGSTFRWLDAREDFSPHTPAPCHLQRILPQPLIDNMLLKTMIISLKYRICYIMLGHSKHFEVSNDSSPTGYVMLVVRLPALGRDRNSTRSCYICSWLHVK